MTNSKMVYYPWDSVPHSSPTWDEIKGKAQHYKTAYRRSDGKILALLGVKTFACGGELAEPVFQVRDEIGVALMATDELCGFVL